MVLRKTPYGTAAQNVGCKGSRSIILDIHLLRVCGILYLRLGKQESNRR